jgi:hypothetical protein
METQMCYPNHLFKQRDALTAQSGAARAELLTAAQFAQLSLV